jgi:hypothetical protein
MPVRAGKPSIIIWPPGKYRFVVSASNGDNLWNEAGASMNMEVPPGFNQTIWFGAACVAVFFALLWALYRYRLYQMRQEFNALFIAIIPSASNELTGKRMRTNNEGTCQPPVVCDSIRSTPAERSPSRCHRERCTPAAARRLSAKAETTSVDLVRSAVLGRFVWGLAQLALPAALRAGRHRRPVAAGAFSQVLGAAVQGEPPGTVADARLRSRFAGSSRKWSSPIRCGVRHGFTENSRCLASRSLSEPSRESPKAAADTKPDLEDVSSQPHRPNGVHRFLYRPHGHHEVLFVFLVLEHRRRQVLHFNVTEHPTADWTSQQIVEAFADRDAPRYLIRDRDSIYGSEVRLRIASLGIEEVLAAPRSPWQNPYVERLIGSIRRDCLNHFVILNARHLKRILASYFVYYHGS